jgi:hypothetical protein
MKNAVSFQMNELRIAEAGKGAELEIRFMAVTVRDSRRMTSRQKAVAKAFSKFPKKFACAQSSP